jgi:hypothetical protein
MLPQEKSGASHVRLPEVRGRALCALTPLWLHPHAQIVDNYEEPWNIKLWFRKANHVIYFRYVPWLLPASLPSKHLIPFILTSSYNILRSYLSHCYLSLWPVCETSLSISFRFWFFFPFWPPQRPPLLQLISALAHIQPPINDLRYQSVGYS